VAQPLTARGARTRELLLSAARRVFERDGYAGASVIEITREAGVANGTFYTYFDSKQAIFLELVDTVIERIFVLTRPPAGLSVTARIRTANRQFLDHYVQDAAFLRVINEASAVDPAVQAVTAAATRRATVPIERQIRRLQQESGILPGISPSALALVLGGAVQQVATYLFVLGNVEEQAVIEDALVAVWTRALELPGDGA
jgi:AcrR family transcriptional regulator